MSWKGPGYRKSRIEVSQVLVTFNCQRRGPKQDPPVISEYTNLKKMLAEGRGKKKYPARQCTVCAAHKKRSIWKYCVVPIHKGPSFEKYNSVTNY